MTTDDDELKPHDYVPSTLHMGDCAVCGHLQYASIHSRDNTTTESMTVAGMHITLADIEPTSLVIQGGLPEGGELVRISLKTGAVVFGEHYTPDVAARAFWEAISDDYRRMLRWKEKHGDED